jgi:type IV pilus assembly protein PilA
MTRAREQGRRSERRSSATGFTLVELMVVIMITALLATLAVYGVRKYLQSVKMAEAGEMITAIRAAQESYRAETFSYKDVSGVNALSGSGTNYPTFYPSTAPLKHAKASWGGGSDAVANAWRELGVTASAPVYYIYGCAAGPGTMIPAAAPAALPITNYPPSSATGQPWYLIEAVGDLDGNGTVGTWVSTSLAAEVYHSSNEE